MTNIFESNSSDPGRDLTTALVRGWLDLLLGDYFGERVEFPEPTEQQLAMMAKADAAGDSLSNGLRLMQTRPPKNETRQQRIDRYRMAVDQWRAWRANYIASHEFKAKRSIRHGRVWLYERLAVQNASP